MKPKCKARQHDLPLVQDAASLPLQRAGLERTDKVQILPLPPALLPIPLRNGREQGRQASPGRQGGQKAAEGLLQAKLPAPQPFLRVDTCIPGRGEDEAKWG